jgi:hypothetical protein
VGVHCAARSGSRSGARLVVLATLRLERARVIGEGAGAHSATLGAPGPSSMRAHGAARSQKRCAGQLVPAVRALVCREVADTAGALVWRARQPSRSRRSAWLRCMS